MYRNPTRLKGVDTVTPRFLEDILMAVQRKVRPDFDKTKEYSVNVATCSKEEKRMVQQAFFDVGIVWRDGGKKYGCLDRALYTNTRSSGEVTSYLMFGDPTDAYSITPKEFLDLVYEPEPCAKEEAVTQPDHPAAAQAAYLESITPVDDFKQKEQTAEIQSKFKRAPDILAAGAKHMEDRAALRDSPKGERSMKATVAAFNALEGTNLTEVQGWRFMCVLKHARAVKGDLSIDDYEDAAAYWALAAEAAQQQ